MNVGDFFAFVPLDERAEVEAHFKSGDAKQAGKALRDIYGHLMRAGSALPRHPQEFFRVQLPEYCSLRGAPAEIYDFVLDVVETASDEVAKRGRDRVDICAALIWAARTACVDAASDAQMNAADGGGAAPVLDPEPNKRHTARAVSLLCGSQATSFSPKVYSALVFVFHCRLKVSRHIAYARSLMSRGADEDEGKRKSGKGVKGGKASGKGGKASGPGSMGAVMALEVLSRLKLHCYVDPAEFIPQLLKKKLGDVIMYVDKCRRLAAAGSASVGDDEKKKHEAKQEEGQEQQAAATAPSPAAVAAVGEEEHEFDVKPVTDAAALSAFVVRTLAAQFDPTKALQLMSTWRLDPSLFPRVFYNKHKDCIWFCVINGTIDSFARALVEDVVEPWATKLREYMCRQLMKRKDNLENMRKAVRYLQKYQLHVKGGSGGLESKQEFVEMLAQAKEVIARAEAHAEEVSVSADAAAGDAKAAGGGNGSKPTTGTAKPVKRGGAAGKRRQKKRTLAPGELSEEAAGAGYEEKYRLHLDSNRFSLVMVDDAKGLAAAEALLLSPSITAIGLDLEHTPNNFQELDLYDCFCATLQVATHTHVFIFDLPALLGPGYMLFPGQHVALKPRRSAAVSADSGDGDAPAVAAAGASFDAKSVTPSEAATAGAVPAGHASNALRSPPPTRAAFDALFTRLLDDEGVVKLGMGFPQDQEDLRQDWPTMRAFQMPMQAYAELDGLAARVPAALFSKVIPPPPRAVLAGKTKEGGLSRLVRLVVGRLLDKSEQCSNWHERPLSRAQLDYAALDVVSEILIYDRMKTTSTLSLVLPDEEEDEEEEISLFG